MVDTLNAEISGHMKIRSSEAMIRRHNGVIPFGQVLMPCIVVCIMLAVILALSEYRAHFLVGIVSSIGIIIAATAITVFACRHYRENVHAEVVDEIKRIVCDYLDELESIPHDLERDPKSEAAVLSGNPHVSIVTVYRDMQWQRIPSLLLVEGDIVALMGGDIAPGSVQELLPLEDPVLERPPGAAQQESADGTTNGGAVFNWRKLSNKVIRKGEKIRLRKGKKASNVGSHRSGRVRSKMSIYGRQGGGAAAPDKQRIVSSNSLELLHFSGDIRCFLLCETPIASYCRDILTNDLEQMKKGADHTASLDLNVKSLLPRFLWPMCGLTEDMDESFLDPTADKTDSFLVSVLNVVVSKGMKILLWLELVLLVAAMLRFIFVPETRHQWGQIVAIPFTTILMCFFPLSLPLSLILAEILTTASLLTSIELSLKRDDNKSGSTDSPLPGAGPAGASVTTPVAATAKEPGYGGFERAGSHSQGSGEDEFKDEDIDDRYVWLRLHITMSFLS